MLGKIKDAMFWFQQVKGDGSKLDGHFFSKGKNELELAITEGERELHEEVFGRSPFSSLDASDSIDTE